MLLHQLDVFKEVILFPIYVEYLNFHVRTFIDAHFNTNRIKRSCQHQLNASHKKVMIALTIYIMEPSVNCSL